MKAHYLRVSYADGDVIDIYITDGMRAKKMAMDIARVMLTDEVIEMHLVHDNKIIQTIDIGE